MTRDDIENIVYGFLPAKRDAADAMREAMSYSVTVGGKRIRPMIMYAAYELFGGCGRDIEPFMAAIEMIHSYSLVHDDLPAMDGDELRRGNLTTWKKYGEAQGILAGDGLLTYAFETAVKTMQYGADPERALKAIGILSAKAGLYGMVGGQAVDVALAEKETDPETLMYIYENKTGALIEASMMIGALMAGADDEQVKTCESIASKIGLAFQIKDDILDITSSEEELGKPIGSDAKNNKTTYATIYGLKASQEKVYELSLEAKNLLSLLPGDKRFFTDLIDKLSNRTY